MDRHCCLTMMGRGPGAGVLTPKWRNEEIYSQGHTAEYTRKIVNVSERPVDGSGTSWGPVLQC